VATSPKDPETDRLARENLRRRDQAPGLPQRLHAIGAHCAGLPDRDTRTPDEIAGYDENGMWR
jgi:antitoxin VapB